MPVVAGLTVLAFALRLQQLDQSLFGDELFLFEIVHDSGLGGVLGAVHDTESTPPLHFVLAWATAQVGDPTVWVRLPSLVLGTATVPLVYLLGARTIGRGAGLIGAALIAIAPYAIFYGTDARAYATLAFLGTLSTLTLLAAVESARSRWWVLFAVSAAAALYTHYTAIFVTAAQIGWALWGFPAHRRAVILSVAGIVLLYVAWIPSFLVQRRDSAEQRIPDLDSLDAVVADLLRVLPGHPFVRVSELPGRPWLIVIAAVLAAAAAAASLQAVRRRRVGEIRRRREVALIAAVASAAPVGTIVYSLGPTSIFLPRNLITSFPAACVAVGGLLARLRRPWRELAVAATILAVSAGTVKMLAPEVQRPPFQEVAHYVDEAATRTDRIVADLEEPHPEALKVYLQREHTVVEQDDGSQATWGPAARSGSVFVVRWESGFFGAVGLPPVAGPENRILLQEETRYPGLVPLTVGRYASTVEGRIGRRNRRRTISWSLDENVEVSSDSARGRIDEISSADGRPAIRGWAMDAAGRRAADWVLAFSGRALVAVGAPDTFRPDVARVYGESALGSGFALTPWTALENGRRLRLFAVVGNRASQLRHRR